ncbi:efflux RND transporter periplasmic adaptor subunit [Balneolaceae bacterium ANBcel3]|nr:efflux RND transporter periplasmic adaptor subunit [Balneolaceae bacterium ANBcel3]
MKKAAIKFLLIGFIPFLFFSGCGNEEEQGGFPGGGMPPPQSAVSVEAIPVTESSISRQIRSFGTIQAQDVVSIIPQVSNRVTRIYADLGDEVSQGDLLAKIYDTPYKDALEQAQAQLRQSRAALNRDSTAFVRQKQLLERSAASQSELDNARSAYESSRASYESARAALTHSREDLANTEIRSPVDGVVLGRSIAVGDLARSGEAAFEIANLVGYEVRLHLPMQDWDAASVGMPVDMSLSNNSESVAHGVISRISPQLNPVTGLGEVVVTLTDVSGSVRQGMLVQSRITLLTKSDVVVVPRSALLEQVDTYIEPETNTVELSRNYYAFVAVGDTTAERRPLELGLEQGERVEIISGLEKGESLIVTGHSNIGDGAPVQVIGLDDEQDYEEQRIELEEDEETGVESERRGDGSGQRRGMRDRAGNN